jgi:transposase
MQVKYERCCGLDVHKETVVACLIVSGASGHVRKTTRTFSTLTGELTALAQWLKEEGCGHAVMESTGVYWKPVYNLLTDTCEVLVVNAAHIKKFGDKTDVSDAEWLADLLRHGLVRGSFIPSVLQRALRDLTRYRTRLIDDRSREVNRVQKVLEDANLKLASVASDVMGVSSRAILAQLIEGQSDPALLAELAKGRLREKRVALEQALTGRFTAHHRFMLVQHLSHIDYLDEQIAKLDAEIVEQIRPFQVAVDRWDQLPGINQRTGQVIVAEVGADLKPFADAAHLASWVGCVRAIRKVPANGTAARHARAASGCGGRWWRPRTAPPAPKTRTSPPCIIAWPDGGERNAPWWPSGTVC